MAALGVVSVALNTLADLVVAYFAGPLGERLGRDPSWWRRQRRVTGGALIGLGVVAALGDRR